MSQLTHLQIRNPKDDETFDEALINIKEAIQLYLSETKKESFTPSYKKQFVVPVQIYA